MTKKTDRFVWSDVADAALEDFKKQLAEPPEKAIGEEVARLLVAGFIVEVFHREWLANLVLAG